MEQKGNMIAENPLFENLSDIDLFQVDSDELLWDKLIQQIIEGNVIPVIGADVLIDNHIDGNKNLHGLIVDFLSKRLHLTKEHHSFSDLVFDTDTDFYQGKRQDLIYGQVSKLFAVKRFPASDMLKKLLSIRQFPFVITTSFSPIVEQTMRDIWKDELRVMRFNNNPSENDDVKDANDLKKPTVYYMFGKASEGTRRYVLTDTDMLDFCSSWLDSTTRPNSLCGSLRDKYLLMLGNNYSDWLFRFIWYSIRRSSVDKKVLGEKCMMAYSHIDEKLIHFLERAETFTKQNPSLVIDQIVARLNDKLLKSEHTKFNKPEENVDVFISYSRSDRHIAERLYDELTKQGLRVWYDKLSLTDGGRFMDEIRKAIRSARYFVPILSDNITREKNESHVYRNEWDVAIDVAISMGRTYIIPLAEEGFDFYTAAIPEKMQQHNAIYFNGTWGIESVVQKIIHKMNQD